MSLLGSVRVVRSDMFLKFFLLLNRAFEGGIVDVNIRAAYERETNRGTLTVDVLLFPDVSFRRMSLRARRG